MAFGLFKKHCAMCGEDIKSDKAIKKFGKHFCSEQHAEQHRAKMDEKRPKGAKGGSGCCG